MLEQEDSELRRVSLRETRFRRRDILRAVTMEARIAECGQKRIASVVQIRQAGGTAHYAGIHSCGRIWDCPKCAAKVGHQRAGEIATVLSGHVATGGAVAHQVFTLRHGVGHDLERLRRVVARGFTAILSGKSWQTVARRFGRQEERTLRRNGVERVKSVPVMDFIRACEVTVGAHGWHPHLHVVFLFRRPLSAEERAEFEARNFKIWRRVVTEAGLPAPLPRHSPLILADHTNIAGYAAKFALEVARADLKTGRGAAGRKGRHPFQILDSLGVRRTARDCELWWEYEHGMRGAKMLTWSRGLKAHWGLVDKSDEVVAAEEVPGAAVAELSPKMWAAVCRAPGAALRLLELAERGGAPAVMLEVGTLLAKEQRTREAGPCWHGMPWPDPRDDAAA